MVSVIGAGGQPFAGDTYSFNLSDARFNRTIITGPKIDWSAFNTELELTSPHSLMQWTLTDSVGVAINGTVTSANFGTNPNVTYQAAIDLTPPFRGGIFKDLLRAPYSCQTFSFSPLS
jgi:hypothetical protein